jgi:ATP-dependent DNA helicase RecQ
MEHTVTATHARETPLEVLQRVFGYPAFRPLQEQVIRHVCDGKHGLVILPTGGGKSLCFQIPALLIEGITLVVSPLIALMKDQVEALRLNGVPAYAINSSLSYNERQEIHELLSTRRIRLLYVSPEKLLTPAFIDYLRTLPIRLIAVDEAHCVSMWGNDFRPEYARLMEVCGQFDGVPRLALTATADPATQKDICEKLSIDPAHMYIGSFERPNLFLEVRPAYRRIEAIYEFLRERPGEAGIVYCLSRKSTEQVAEKLAARGFKVAAYHAHLSTAERSRVQEAFLQDKLQIVCATIAFGMGIDKPNIRWVIHYNLPKNVESYYQEIGRAGRDGLPAHTLLFAGYGDVISYRGMIMDSEAPDEYKRVQVAKLMRMFEYAQSTSCRTNFVLAYFGEQRGTGCGHCDLCKAPPTTFDGTVLAQKALSGVRRTNEEVSINQLVDFLRGARTQMMYQRRYDQLKTYGVGSDLSREQWLSYITQLINQGHIAVDFTDFNKLRVTPLGEEVLFQQRPVLMVSAAVESKPTREKPAPRIREKPRDLFRRELLSHLRTWRANYAADKGIAPTHVLGDDSLVELAAKAPLLLPILADISGFSAHKIETFGQQVLAVIRDYGLHQTHVPKLKGETYIRTLQLLDQGHPPERVAQERELALSTIYVHILHLYEAGEPIELTRYIDPALARDTGALWERLGKPEFIAPLLEHLPPDTDSHLLRLELAWYKSEGKK